MSELAVDTIRAGYLDIGNDTIAVVYRHGCQSSEISVSPRFDALFAIRPSLCPITPDTIGALRPPLPLVFGPSGVGWFVTSCQSLGGRLPDIDRRSNRIRRRDATHPWISGGEMTPTHFRLPHPSDTRTLSAPVPHPPSLRHQDPPPSERDLMA
jgi:hypothetical protein